jgi:hypothetical protein
MDRYAHIRAVEVIGGDDSASTLIAGGEKLVALITTGAEVS